MLLPTIEAADARRVLGRGDPFVRQMNALAIQLHFVILRQTLPFASRPRQVAASASACRLRAASFSAAFLALSSSPSAALMARLAASTAASGGVPRLVQLDHLPRHHIGRPIFRRVIVRRAADDQRRPGLVDQDRVHLVHDRELQRTLHLLGRRVLSCCRAENRSRIRCWCRR